MGRAGEYQLQAAIAALHAQADSFEKTDWWQIVALYKLLLNMNPSPTIALNHAATVSMANGPEAGLKLCFSQPKMMIFDCRFEERSELTFT